MENQNKFVKIYSQTNSLAVTEIWVDTSTGVNYFYYSRKGIGSLTAMFDENGKPVITPPDELERIK